MSRITYTLPKEKISPYKICKNENITVFTENVFSSILYSLTLKVYKVNIDIVNIVHIFVNLYEMSDSVCW